jgi:hypothetical protein
MVDTASASAILACKDAWLLLVSARGSGCVRGSSVVALVEETHCECGVRGRCRRVDSRG